MIDWKGYAEALEKELASTRLDGIDNPTTEDIAQEIAKIKGPFIDISDEHDEPDRKRHGRF